MPPANSSDRRLPGERLAPTRRRGGGRGASLLFHHGLSGLSHDDLASNQVIALADIGNAHRHAGFDRGCGHGGGGFVGGRGCGGGAFVGARGCGGGALVGARGCGGGALVGARGCGGRAFVGFRGCGAFRGCRGFRGCGCGGCGFGIEFDDDIGFGGWGYGSCCASWGACRLC